MVAQLAEVLVQLLTGEDAFSDTPSWGTDVTSPAPFGRICYCLGSVPGGVKNLKRAASGKKGEKALIEAATAGATPLWQLDIAELAGHNIESRGREEVNRLLSEGWILLHIYTLKYEEEGVWRERPMAILGRPRGPVRDTDQARSDTSSMDGLDKQSTDLKG
jgi:hypothetical protein